MRVEKPRDVKARKGDRLREEGVVERENRRRDEPNQRILARKNASRVHWRPDLEASARREQDSARGFRYPER